MQIMETSSNYSQSKDEPEFKKKVAAYLHKPQWKGYSINNGGRIQYRSFNGVLITGIQLTSKNWRKELCYFKKIIDTVQIQELFLKTSYLTPEFCMLRGLYLRYWMIMYFDIRRAKIGNRASQSVMNFVIKSGKYNACIYMDKTRIDVFNFIKGKGLWIKCNFPSRVSAIKYIHEMDKNQWDWNVLIQQE